LRLVADAPALSRPAQRPLHLGWAAGAALEARAGAQAAAATLAPGDVAQPAAALDPYQNARALNAHVSITAHVPEYLPMYSRMRIVGQLFAGYIALEGDEGFILVDQHAAHERVTFEKLRAELRAGGVRVQPMLTPVAVELQPARAAAVMVALDEFRAMGFELEPFGPATLLLKGAPAVFGVAEGARLLSEMIEAMGEDAPSGANNAGALENLLKQLACHGSVRVGRVLREPEMAALLEELDRTEFKSNCPHGRPVHIQWHRGAIERAFRR